MAIRFSNGFGIGASNNGGGGGPLSFFTNISGIASYLSGYMSDFRNPDFYEYLLDGNGFFINDGGGDMMDGANVTTPWLRSNATYTGSTAYDSVVYPYAVNYETTGTTGTIDTSFGYISLGYNHPNFLPLTVIGTRATIASPGTPIGFQCGGNIGADGAGSIAQGTIYTGDIVSGFTVHAYYREIYDAGDPSVCDVFILLGHPDWNSVFGNVYYGGADVSDGSCGSYLYTTGNGAQNILAIKTLLSKPNGSGEVTFSEVNTVVDNFIIRVKEAKENLSVSPTPTPTSAPLTQFLPNGSIGPNGLITWLDYTTGINASNNIIDLSPFNNEFTYSGSNPWSNGVTGYTFTGGGSSYASATSTTQYNQILNSFTIEMWVKIPSIPATMSLLAAGGNNSGGWALRMDNSGTALNFVKYNVSDQTVYLNSQFQSNTWYHIVVAQGGTSLTYMINGEIVGASNSGANNNLSIPNGTVNISKDFYTGTNEGLVLGSLKVYDYCRISSDITDDFNSSKGGYGFIVPTATPTSTELSPTPTGTNEPTPTPSSTPNHGFQYTLIDRTDVTGPFGTELFSLACEALTCLTESTCNISGSSNLYFDNENISVGDYAYLAADSNVAAAITDGYYILSDGGLIAPYVFEFVSNQVASILTCPSPTNPPTATATQVLPTGTPEPTPTSTPEMALLSINVIPQITGITFDGVLYTSDTTISVVKNQSYTAICVSGQFFTFDGTGVAPLVPNANNIGVTITGDTATLRALTNQPSPLPTPTATSALNPTGTPAPTNTSTPTGTPSPTGTPAPTGTPTPTATVQPLDFSISSDCVSNGRITITTFVGGSGQYDYTPSYFNTEAEALNSVFWSQALNPNVIIATTVGSDGTYWRAVRDRNNQSDKLAKSITISCVPTPTPTNTLSATPEPTGTSTPIPTGTPEPTPTSTSAPNPTPTATSASAPMTVTIYESGSNVVMSASGTVDLSGLTLVTSGGGPNGGGGLGIGTATFICGSNGTYFDTYSGFTSTPTNFGSGSGLGSSSSSGQVFGIIVDGTPPYLLVVPTGYTSGVNISSTQTFNNTSLSTLGLTNGTYTYTWSGGSIDVVVGGTPGPTGTPAPTSSGAGWNFYDTAGTVITNPPLSDGQILMYTNAGGPPTSTYNPNNGGAQYILFYKKDSAGTDYTTQFTNLQTNGGTINVTQNGNTATYVGGSGVFNFDPAGFLVIPTAIQTVTVASPFTFGDTITLTIS